MLQRALIKFDNTGGLTKNLLQKWLNSYTRNASPKINMDCR